MAIDAYGLYYSLQGSGFFEFLLPFLLVFVISFAILEKIKIFPSTGVNGLLSAILGLLIVTQFEIVQTMTTFLPKASLFLVIAVMFMFLIGLFGVDMTKGFNGVLLGIATLIALFAMYWSLSPALGINDLFVPYWIQDNWGWVISIIIVMLVWFALSTYNKGKPKEDWKKHIPDMDEAINKLLGGKK